MKYDNSELTSNKILAWQPSTWPESTSDIKLFIENLQIIFKDSLLNEIENVISDATKINGDTQHRGHVIALALFCAIDTLSSYAFENELKKVCPTCGRGEKIGPRYQKYIEEFFPNNYKPFAEDLYKAYRTSLVHSWNLFTVGITPDYKPIENTDGVLSLGLLNFNDALKESVSSFMKKVQSDIDIQTQALKRYNDLRRQVVD